MALGTAAGGQCFGTQAEAATMLCSSLHGVSSGGALACVGVSGASTVDGGAASPSFTLRSSSGDTAMTVALLPCETYGFDYWQPMVAAWVLAAVAIIAARMTYERIFGSPTHA